MYTIPFLDIPPLQGAHGVVRLPGSKSISNRVLLLAALCQGATTEVCDVLASDDTDAMLGALQMLGCRIEREGSVLRITGLQPDAMPAQASLHLGNAGTAMRPLTAALALLLGDGQVYELTGVARMQERPIGDLVEALRQLGCEIEYLRNEGFPPLRLRAADPARRAGHTRLAIRGDVSSQFLTAMLMALPLLAAERAYTIEVEGELISKPYIAITLELLARFGVQVDNEQWQRFTIPAGSAYRSPGQIHVEADASSASYFLALGGIASDAGQGHSITIEGVGADSIQGDIRFAQAAAQMGVQIESGPNWLRVQRGRWPLQAIELDCNHIPDAAMTLAVMALYAEGTTRLTNIGSWRVKETDRIDAMAAECAKLGARVESGPDWIAITPPAAGVNAGEGAGRGGWRAASIATYDDHRMAMCFSLAAFNPAGLPVRIEDPRCVGKTFPDYFETLFGVVQALPGQVPVICIDGPSASGKGSLAAAVAAQLGYAVLDSGALYRIAGYAACARGIPLHADHAPELAQVVQEMDVAFVGETILLGGEDISLKIRSDTGSRNASLISAIPAVRDALLQFQRDRARLPGLVADGRDMGTVVFPQAPLKVFLTASAEKRAERRYKQLISQGLSANMTTLREELHARDLRDSTRAVAPLQPAVDALSLDNSDIGIEAAARQVLSWWEERRPFSESSRP
ncbi:bifunctional 3-phosphoshikimate 1-carboxyvinyltransferase/cytidylate kinase [Corticibacter populi]|uniref:Multifunctional fusion protein n=1 Tax=Corticibacter populi TaxID=1550736 RepID=A0A3M6QUL6_9BURK|nr:bifunctional 3-phosphoshikimate 1-carboxyvinyltransferase/cytidylate kinase [Corticibacter populi]RMX06571.1 bifunctional 3-phosphoshikimate 1-carboxyvinyltransferase/cytidylate kinase [Corticibacter populi]RZS31862.1 3-phosphoshikimate 1-carboxyvinyltransferase [Corticibacter populi]